MVQQAMVSQVLVVFAQWTSDFAVDSRWPRRPRCSIYLSLVLAGAGVERTCV